MLALQSANELAGMILRSQHMEELGEVVAATANELGFQYHALARHPRVIDGSSTTMRMHNYPREWEEGYDRRNLGICDPIHRASQRVATGFRWKDTAKLVPIGERDRGMLAEARAHDIEDGYTIPANVPGEPSGSVTFATRVGRPFPEHMLIYAQALGSMAYQQARTIEGVASTATTRAITDRQAEVAKWVGRDKSDWEIAHILGIAPSTVSKHVSDLLARLDATKRASLPLRAIRAGYLCFTDIFG